MSVPELELQGELDVAIDSVLDVLEKAAGSGVDVDPLATIIARVQARGTELSMDDMPPVMKMLLGGMLG